MTARTPRRHFSMIRSFHLADLFTIANAFCGVGAIFEAMKYLGSLMISKTLRIPKP